MSCCHDLVGPQEIATQLHVQPQTVHAWNHRGHLPAPHHTISGVPLWHWPTIQTWAAETGRLEPTTT